MSMLNDSGNPATEHRIASCTRIYATLTRLYPEGLREEHAEEMVSCFKHLCRRELQSRGQWGLTLLWLRTLMELIVTTFRERAGLMTTNAYLPVAPVTAIRWGAVCALLGGFLGVGYDLTMNLWPVGMGSWIVPGIYHLMPMAAAVFLSLLGMFGIYGTLADSSQRSGATPSRLACAGALLTLFAVATLSAGFFMTLWAYAGAEAPSMDPDVLNWGAWWYRELQWILHISGLLSWAAGLLLLGVSAFRKRMLGVLRFVPLIALVLLCAQQVHDDVFPMLTYSLPFLGSALLGWALLRTTRSNKQRTVERGAEHGAT